MFERFTSAHTTVETVFQGDIQKLKKIIRSGCSIDRRSPPYYPRDSWMTPLDAAAASGNEAITDLLLASGASIWGSSIFEAIEVDSLPVLKVFHKYNPLFWKDFLKEKGSKQNPHLNRWLLLFSALDYSLSIGATKCSQFLTEIGATKKEIFTFCRKGHYSPIIEDWEFISSGGVNIDGRSIVTKGYYCAKCKSFL